MNSPLNKLILISFLIGSSTDGEVFAAEVVKPARIEVCNATTFICRDVDVGTTLGELTAKHNSKTNQAVRVHFSYTDTKRNRWLFIGDVGDTLSLKLNGVRILDLSDESGLPRYTRYLSLFSPLPEHLLKTNSN